MGCLSGAVKDKKAFSYLLILVAIWFEEMGLSNSCCGNSSNASLACVAKKKK